MLYPTDVFSVPTIINTDVISIYNIVLYSIFIVVNIHSLILIFLCLSSSPLPLPPVETSSISSNLLTVVRLSYNLKYLAGSLSGKSV